MLKDGILGVFFQKRVVSKFPGAIKEPGQGIPAVARRHDSVGKRWVQ
jgi:hypothetical protein